GRTWRFLGGRGYRWRRRSGVGLALAAGIRCRQSQRERDREREGGFHGTWGVRFTLPSYRVVQPQFEVVIERQRLGHPLLRGEPDLFDPPAEAEIVEQPEVPRAVPVALVLESLQVVELQVAVAAHALADPPLEPVGADGESQVETRQALARVVDVWLHQVGHRVARRLARDVGAGRQVRAHGGVLRAERAGVRGGGPA